MARALCVHCQIHPVAANRRKYCSDCGPFASTFWKKAKRCEWSRTGQKYWLDNWKHKSVEERKAYYRNYMRSYRQRLRMRRRPTQHGFLGCKNQNLGSQRDALGLREAP